MKFSSLGALTLLSCVAVVAHSPDAQACGGCFHGVDEAVPSVVTGHRMALALSPTHTVLWDQVQYTGDPKDFAWVLPVGDGAYIEESTDAFFEALEAVSATRVMSPILVCNGTAVQQQEGSGFGCGGTSTSDSLAPQSTGFDTIRQGDVDGVIVEHEGTVGPYETATIKSMDPMALRTWLQVNGYAIPADIGPVIDAYVAEGASFIALRLQPGAGVRQMTPVRVITPGASTILPLRMVAAGTGANVSIVLYVIGEGRYAAQDRPAALIDPQALSWDWSQSKSNYSTLRDAALLNGEFLTSFALSQGMTARVTTPENTPALYDVPNNAAGAIESYDNFVELYFGQAAANVDEVNQCASTAAALHVLPPGSLVVPTCTDPMCPPPANGTVEAKKFECAGFTDVATALVGMHPEDVWITRLEATLPRAALGTDLTIGADPSQSAVNNWLVAAKNETPPCTPGANVNPPPDDSGGGCTVRAARMPSAVLGGISFLGILFAARRWTGRRRRSNGLARHSADGR